MSRPAALVALLLAGLLGTTGCGPGAAEDPAPAAPTAAPQVPPLPSLEHRFHDLVYATMAGIADVDLARWSGSGQELAYAIYGEDYQRFGFGFATDGTTGRFCATDTARHVWFLSTADPAGGRVEYFLGDGEDCAPDGRFLHTSVVVTEDRLRQRKGTRITRDLLRAATRTVEPTPPEPLH